MQVIFNKFFRGYLALIESSLNLSKKLLLFSGVPYIMAFRVVEFSSQGYKIRKVFG